MDQRYEAVLDGAMGRTSPWWIHCDPPVGPSHSARLLGWNESRWK